MKNIKLIIITIALIGSYSLSAQVSITTDGSSADPSAMLDVKSSDKGMLIPRMTQSEIEAITTPANGLTVYNTNINRFYFYDEVDGEWKEIALGQGTIAPFVTPCGAPLVDSRDGKSYATIQIGTQCWMAENLNIGTMINASGDQSDNSTIEKYCPFNNSINCNTYGGLYQWNEMMQYATSEGIQGICPTGWHLPTNAEWCALENEVDAGTIPCSSYFWHGTDAGGNLKETTTTHWYSPNTGATNSSGFTALPGGLRNTSGSFNDYRYYAHYWSSSEYNNSNAWEFRLFSSRSDVYTFYYDKNVGYSVRCVRD